MKTMKTIRQLICPGALVPAFALTLVSCGGGGGNAPATAPGITKQNFGQLNGRPVDLYTLTNTNGIVAKITTYGGIITELHVPDRNGAPGDIVLGFDRLDGYLTPAYKKNNPYFGALIGRYCTRITKGQFTLDNTHYQLTPNDGPNHLHGGASGFNTKLWTARPIPRSDANSLELTLTSPDGDEGYPGTLHVTVTYTLTDANELKIDYRATTDKPTPFNPTNHTYFNLSAGAQPTIAAHELTLPAATYTEMDDAWLPTGNLAPVAGTPMDFTTPQKIGARLHDNYPDLKHDKGGYAHSWILDKNTAPGSLAPALAATVYEPESGRLMEVFTTQPAMHFYAGSYLDGTLTGKRNITYPQYAGLCLETQHLPDSPNHPAWPTTILRPGQEFQSQTIFKFSTK